MFGREGSINLKSRHFRTSSLANGVAHDRGSHTFESSRFASTSD